MLSPEKNPEAAGDDRFRLAMVSSGIGMAIVDLEGRWLEVNPALERMLGYAAADLVGRSVFDIIHPDDVETSRHYVARPVEGELPVLDAQKRYLHRNGEVVWVHINVAMMRDADGTPLYFISQLRDVTAERAAEQALQDCNATLEQRVAERTAALEQSNRQQDLFADGVSHDLRAPLRAIDSFAQLLSAQYGDGLDETGRGYVDRIRGAARRMGELIDTLLELSRVTRNELRTEPVDLSLLAEWACAELQEAEPERAADVTVQHGLLACGDERHLKRLLDQLLDNAWKFSRGRERVRIEVSGERRGERLVLSVRDHGSGFDMRYAEKMFEPFQRLHGPEQGGGNGLGLAIAQRIVERPDGRLWAESEPGTGAVFRAELPAPQDSEEHQA
ncbi:MAG: sensor histidine kinase [Luteimonas sp.]